MKTYEALFIFAGSLNEEALESAIERARGEIDKLGGTVQGTHSMGKRTFARRLKKAESGYYVRIDCSMEPAGAAMLQSKFKLDESVFRLQIVNADDLQKSVEAAEDSKKEEADSDGVVQSSLSDG